MQRYLNFWFSSSLDLFGADVSSNAASYFASGLKGRPDEESYPEHLALDQSFALERPDGKGGVTMESVPLRSAMNEVVRGSYIKDCQIGVTRWNRTIAKAGFAQLLALPSPRFRRAIGSWANLPIDPSGALLDADAWAARKDSWLPSESDRAFVHSLMQRVIEPGKMAAWIAPPDRGINNLPVEYEYVKLH
jgi:benzoyl-CoA 2,3-dioxygenase component B